VGWAAAVQIVASQHFNSAWTPRAGSAACVNRTRNTSRHPDHTHTKGAIRIKRQHRYGRRINSGSWRYSRRIAANIAKLPELLRMSALPPKADIDKLDCDVPFVPKADIRCI